MQIATRSPKCGRVTFFHFDVLKSKNVSLRICSFYLFYLQSESHAFRYFTVTLDLFTMAVRPLNENALNIWSEFIPILGCMGFPERGRLPGIACQQILIKDEISRVNLKESAHEIMFLVSITPPISIRENASAEKKKEKYGEKRGISFTSKIE